MNSQGLVFNPWTSDKLKLLLENNCTNFYSVIYDIISCKQGKRFKIDNKNQTARISSLTNSNIVMDIPLPLELGVEWDKRVEIFMTENRLDNYTFINLDNIEKRYK